MEGDEKIGLVLARASELRFKISDAIECSGCRRAETEHSSDEEEEEKSLLSIRDALESLEKQVASLQVLHQQQRYEREATLAQIDRSRKLLLTKLKEYKGEELDVIHEAATFASETVDSDDGFFLPPYPSHLHEFFGLNDLYSSPYRPQNTPSKNGLTVDSIEDQNHLDGPQMKVGQSANQNKPQGLKSILGLIAKSAITFIGIISALSLAGFKTEIRKNDASPLNLLELFRKPTQQKTEEPVQCSPGKTLIMEDGKPHCIVKERIEIPFGSEFYSPSINIGFG